MSRPGSNGPAPGSRPTPPPNPPAPARAIMWWDGGERTITPREKALIEEHSPSLFSIPLVPASQRMGQIVNFVSPDSGDGFGGQRTLGGNELLTIIKRRSVGKSEHLNPERTELTERQGVDMADADSVALEIARRFIPVDSPGAHNEGQHLAALQVAIVDAINTVLAARQPVGLSFQAGVTEWMGDCFLPSLYSNMTERGDRLLEEVLELLQAHGYDQGRVATLVDYVYGRPVGEPAQEVGGVMVTLAGYCWVAGLEMHAAGVAELQRIKQPEVMEKIRRKQEAKNALHFDTPLPGDAAANVEDWPREGDLVRYGDGSSALAIRLGPHAGGWHGYQCCGGYTFFTKAYRPSRADMDTWLDCAKYRDERTKVADSRVAHEMALIDGKRNTTREPRSHRWDNVGERCLDCGDKDWMADPACSGPLDAAPGVGNG